MNNSDPTGQATLFWSGPNRVHIVFYYRMVENGARFNFTPEALKDFVERSVRGTFTYQGRQVEATSSFVVVAPDDMVTGGTDTKTIFQDSRANHRGIQSYADGRQPDGPGGNIHLQEGESVFVAGHEVPHPAGAWDQRAGGVGPNNVRIPPDAIFPNTLMNNSAPHINQQTFEEIVTCRCNINIWLQP